MTRKDDKVREAEWIQKLRANKRNCYHCAENNTGLTLCPICSAANTTVFGDDRLRFCCPLFKMQEEKV